MLGCATQARKIEIIKSDALASDWCRSLEGIKESDVQNEYIVSCFRSRATLIIKCSNFFARSCKVEIKNDKIQIWLD